MMHIHWSCIKPINSECEAVSFGLDRLDKTAGITTEGDML
jgi:hypothetical protein